MAVCLILRAYHQVWILIGCFILVSVTLCMRKLTVCQKAAIFHTVPPASGKNQGINLQVLHYPYAFYLQLSNRSLIGP